MEHTTEDELLEAIRKVLSGAGPEVVVGPGDDAAIVAAGGGELVLTTDVLVEGVHFDRTSASPREIGTKAIAVNVSDVAAMGGSPRTALLGLVLSSKVDAAWTMELFGGVRAACDEYACWLVGGDLSRGDQIVLSVSIIGEVAPGAAVTRSGARVGNAVVVTGRLGASAGGLRLATARPGTVGALLTTTWGKALLDAHLRPIARVGEGQTLAACGATAMIDVSDGLSLDLSRLCRASAVGARVRLADVPVAPELADLAEHAPIDPVELALGGGEDYELLATMPPSGVGEAADRLSRRFGTPLTVIGEIVASGFVAVDSSGKNARLSRRGGTTLGERDGAPRPRVLSIAGSDSGGGAGIQADLKTFSALGCYGMTAITAVTVQNTKGVESVEALSPETVGAQIRAVVTDIGVDAAKTGMLASTPIVEAVADAVAETHVPNLVVDPVFVSKHGHPLLEAAAVGTLRERLLPLAVLVTPNLREASGLAGFRVETRDDMHRAADAILRAGVGAVLVKGGHLEGSTAADLFMDGAREVWLEQQRVETPHTHGTGCTLSSAIASHLARGAELLDAVREGKEFVTRAIRHALALGQGVGPVDQLWELPR